MKPWVFVATVGLLVGCALMVPQAADSQSMGRRGGRGSNPEESRPGGDRDMQSQIRPSGLVPVFPAGTACPGIASEFGSPTRYDGSLRPRDRAGGLHGGIDISLDEGTPLRAIAGGKIVATGTGGQAVGIYVWVQHSPQDTGLPFWVYSKYQHLRDLPTLRVGQAVAVGQVVGLSGKTGTMDGHYGGAGYPHLHLTTVASPADQYEVSGSVVSPSRPRFFDPVAVYVDGLRDVEAISQLPADRRAVPIPHVTEDGSLHPPGARLAWPVACKR